LIAKNDSSLIHGLNTDGLTDRVAVQATYIPSMSRLVIENCKERREEQKMEILAAVFRYLARTLSTGEEIGMSLGVTIIKRDVRQRLQPILSLEDFYNNPGMLDRIDVQASNVVQRA
jgi:hypothetical protein